MLALWHCSESPHCHAGPLADGLIEKGMPVARVRKIAQATAFLGPTACLTAAAVCDDGPATVGRTILLRCSLVLSLGCV